MGTIIQHLSYKVSSLKDEIEFFLLFERLNIFHEFVNQQGERYGVMFHLENGLDVELFQSASPIISPDVHFAFGVSDIKHLHVTLSFAHVTSGIFRGKTDGILQFHVVSPGGFRFEFHEMGA